MGRYRKKPVIIEAFRYKIYNAPEWFKNQKDRLIIENERNCIVKNLEGDMSANYSDYIIKDINGEFYPCKSNIFQKTYEPIFDLKEHETMVERTIEAINNINRKSY